MDNVRCRSIIDQFELLVKEFCIEDGERNQQWLQCIPFYRSCILKLRSKKDLGVEEVASFQNDADNFFQIWVQLWGLEGCTNYIHMLSSGHISTYLLKWRNLYRHSQQGWEAFNSLLKTFYFRRTGHGGATGQGKGRKSKLLPIARWLQRRIIWLCGWDEASIKDWIQKNPDAVRSGDGHMLQGQQHHPTGLLDNSNVYGFDDDDNDNDDIHI